MKLYKVTVEHTFFMVAEDDDDAALSSRDYAQQAVREDLDIDFISEHEVTDLKDVPKEWVDGYPYGENGNDRTVKEWLVG